MLSTASVTTQTAWRLPLKSSAKAEWPDPELSIGKECCSLGRNRCWEVQGPAQAVTECLFPKVKGLLESRNEYLNEKEPIPVAIILGFYMIGRAEKRSNPTLLITCQKKVPRRKALSVVMDSGMLSPYPGVLLAESARSPLSLGPAMLLGLYQPVPANADTAFNIYLALPTDLSKGPYGMSIQIKDAQEGPATSRSATIGGLMYTENENLERKYYGITVGHVFTTSADDHLKSLDNNESDDIDFAFYGHVDDDEEDDQDESHAELTSKDQTAGHEMRKLGNLYASSEDGPLPGLDWAMIEIGSSFQRLNTTMRLYPKRIARKQLEETKVRTCTGSSGILTGTMSGNASLMKFPGARVFQEVWIVRLDGSLSKGDCGSWVVDMESGDFYGQIVAGHLDSGLGYIVPAYQILSNMEEHIGMKLALVQKPSAVILPNQPSSKIFHSLGGAEALPAEHPLLDATPKHKYEGIERLYKCGWNGCGKAYGTLNHLNSHVSMQSHGPIRTPDESKAIREEWKLRKKEGEEEALTQLDAKEEGTLVDIATGLLSKKSNPILHLLSVNGTFESKIITVPYYPNSLRIGRQTNAKTVPTPSNGFFNSKVLSRQHAEIWADRNGKIWIQDVRSSNGTFVNGTRLSAENRDAKPHELRSQDHLQLGIDIVGEDQKTVLHQKVAAKVFHAGFLGAGNVPFDMNLSWWNEEQIQATVNRQFVLSRMDPADQKLLDQQILFATDLGGCTYMEWIERRAKSIFLILVDLGIPDHIFELIDRASLCDNDLPMALDQINRLNLSGHGDEDFAQQFYLRQHAFVVWKAILPMDSMRLMHDRHLTSDVYANPPCNMLVVENIPIGTPEDEVKEYFIKQPGYKRMSYRTRQDVPLCFVEFDDISYASKALTELTGCRLSRSDQDGLRLSFARHPFEVKAAQVPRESQYRFSPWFGPKPFSTIPQSSIGVPGLTTPFTGNSPIGTQAGLSEIIAKNPFTKEQTERKKMWIPPRHPTSNFEAPPAYMYQK